MGEVWGVKVTVVSYLWYRTQPHTCTLSLSLSRSFSQSVSLSKHTLWWTLREGYRLFCHCLYCKLFDFKHVLKLFYPRQRSVFRFCCSHHIFIHRHFYTHTHTHRPHFYNYLHTLTHLHSHERYLLCGIIFFFNKVNNFHILLNVVAWCCGFFWRCCCRF